MSWVVAGMALIGLSPRPVSADGAFADSSTVLLPQTRPQRLIASAADLGLLVSDDDGGSWFWICEEAIGYSAALYQLGPAPDEAYYAITQAGLSVSHDGGCNWQRAAGEANRAFDVFPDPSDEQHVFVAAQDVADPTDLANRTDVVVESHDSGETFSAPLYSTSYASITGVEVAKSNSAVVYLTATTLEQQRPTILSSVDGAQTWMSNDLTGALGGPLFPRPLTLGILAVDPADAMTLYLRVSDGVADSLAISRTGGSTLNTVLQLGALMTAFLRRSDGALIVAGADALSFISTDGGASFSPWTTTFHVRALAERDGAIYASADSASDGFAVTKSLDGGATWHTLLRIDQLKGPLGCGAVVTQCAAPWADAKPKLGELSASSGEDTGVSDVEPPQKSMHGCMVMSPSSAVPTRDAMVLGILCCVLSWRVVRRRIILNCNNSSVNA